MSRGNIPSNCYRPMTAIDPPANYYSAVTPVLPPFPPLRGEARCDVCVVGAGIAGCSAALALAERGYRVILLEAQRVGWGASGRNGGQVLPGLKAKLQAFHAQHKPIGAVCIAPAVVALAFPHAGFELTVGEPGEAAQEITKAGHTHIVCAPQECHVDARHRIVSTPAYMYDDAPLHEIFEGIRKLVSGVMSLSA